MEPIIPAKTIKVEKQSTLVEWRDENGNLCRGYIPSDQIDEDGDVVASNLRMAIPYGEPWGEIFHDIGVDAEQLEAQLYRRGIWTQEQFLSTPKEVQAALQAVVGVTLGMMLRTAKEHFTNG